jgi:hypothetical protein
MGFFRNFDRSSDLDLTVQAFDLTRNRCAKKTRHDQFLLGLIMVIIEVQRTGP